MLARAEFGGDVPQGARGTGGALSAAYATPLARLSWSLMSYLELSSLGAEPHGTANPVDRHTGIAEPPGYPATSLPPPPPPGTIDAADQVRVIARATTGDLEAQAELVRRYQKRIAGLIRTVVRDRDTAEDLVQIVVIKMVRRLQLLQDPARFESWVFRLARNTALDHLRRLRCRPATVPYDPEWHDRAGPDSDGCCHEIREALERALRVCDRRNRQILLQAIEGSSYAEIAQRQQLGVGATKVRLHRLRFQLRATLYPLLKGERSGIGGTKKRSRQSHPSCR